MRVSSSGLIYAVIVGAWAAYLVPMWLRRQDELNEARPTERFSTAIRLLSGKAAMERRYTKDAERRGTEDPAAPGDFGESASMPGEGVDDADESAPDAAEDAVDVRAFADPKTMVGGGGSEAATEIVAPSVSADASASARSDPGRSGGPGADRSGSGRSKAALAKEANRNKRAKLLARRRRTTMVLFLAFTLGSVVAAVGGLAFLWAPAVPAALLSGYIVHLRGNERRRFVVTMDRRRAEAAATRLHERRRSPAAGASPEPEEPAADRGHEAGHAPRRHDERGAADRRALVEQTDHAEWVDQQRARHHEQPEGEGWDPVPVPLPTYVSAPVAPRRTRNVDLEAPDTWSSARSSTVGGGEPQQPPHASQFPHSPQAPVSETDTGSRGRDRSRTPLFDQYEDEERPRAANE